MKYCLSVALVFGLFAGVLNAQELTGIASGVTRALVIGVSDYEFVSDLNYAHRDAQLFADYLKSDAGGKVKPDNIRLLLNNKATLANIADAFDWLYAEAKKGDRVYVYFAGHGDVEKQTPWQHGFLLPYNSPVTNYRLRALPVEELDRLAVTLSTRGARVVIIADACRAGKLAGSEVQGPSLTAEEMSKKKANEIRILSCKPDQKSLEDLNWGGGRGLFSYYLLDGLKGLADADADDRVTLEELEDFMKPKVRAQAQTAANKRQDPIFDGEPAYWIATVDGPTLAALQAERTPAANADVAAAPMVAAAPDMAPPQADMTSRAMAEPLERSANAASLTDVEGLLDLLATEHVWIQIPYYKLNNLSVEKMPAAFLAEIEILNKKHLINWTIEEQLDTVIQKLRVQLNEQPLFYQVFNRQLALALHDFGQQMLNLYLEGDLGELEKRVIPDESARDYEKFPPVYSLAMRLLPENHFLQPNLVFEFHYFSGLAIRLRMDAEGYFSFQFEKALQEELKALEIDNRSPCVHNELGILYQQKKEYQKAEQFYKTAIELAPQWAVPWANLCGLYALTNQLDECLAAGEKALKLHPKLFLATINLGVGMARKKNLLYAESYFRQAIDMHPNHYFAYEQLGLICIQRMNYEEAAEHLNQAEYLKRGMPRINVVAAHPGFINYSQDWGVNKELSIIETEKDSSKESAFLKKIAKNPNNKQAQFGYGKYCRETKRFELAKKHYKLAIAIDTAFVIALDSLGRLASLLKQWEEAEACFLEIWNLLPPDSTLDGKAWRMQLAHKVLLQAYLATGYKQQRRYDRLENAYLTLIELEPEKQHFETLWNLYEQLGRWNDSERTIERMIQKVGTNHKEALNHFYERVISRFPDDLAWKYRYMTVLYEEERHPKEFLWQEPDDSRCVALLEELIMKEKDAQRVADMREKLGNLNLKAINKLEDIIESPGPDQEAQAAKVIQLKNLKTNGFTNLETALASSPEHADLRYKLINLYVSDGNYKKALEHLDSLYAKNQIDLPRRALLAEYSALANRFERGEQMLEESVTIAPFVPANTEALFGLLYMLRGDAPKAVAFFENLIRKGGSTWEHQYALARAQAAAGTRDVALKTLATASSADEYGSLNIILKYDPIWDTFRNDPTWIKLQK